MENATHVSNKKEKPQPNLSNPRSRYHVNTYQLRYKPLTAVSH